MRLGVTNMSDSGNQKEGENLMQADLISDKCKINSMGKKVSDARWKFGST